MSEKRVVIMKVSILGESAEGMAAAEMYLPTKASPEVTEEQNEWNMQHALPVGAAAMEDFFTKWEASQQ